MLEFNREKFIRKGRRIVAVIDPILDEFVVPGYIDHWHYASYPQKPKRGQMTGWATRYLAEKDKILRFVDRKGEPCSLHPASEFPGSDKDAYAFKGDQLFVAPLNLPPKYDPVGAVECGIDRDRDFLYGAENLARWILSDAKEKMRFEGENRDLREFLDDPSILNGFRFVATKADDLYSGITKVGDIVERPWIMIFVYAMRELGIYTDRFAEVTFQSDDNSLNNFPGNFDYQLVRKMIKGLGGWPDFLIRGWDSKSYILCDFTITGKDADGKTLAVVNNAYIEEQNPTQYQEKFAKAVFEAFGVS